VVPALVPLLVLTESYTLAQAGGVVLAATLLSSLAQPAFGALADGRQLPWLRTTGLALGAVGITLTGVLPSYALVLAAALLSGLGVAAYHLEAARAVHATGTGDVGMGWFTFGGVAGYPAGPPVAAALLSTLGLSASPLSPSA
jgi:FSR family fosmidomycin resistance protein-like MFS transporter